MHDARSFTRNYTRLFALCALPLLLLLGAQAARNILPSGHYTPHARSFGGEQLLLWAHVGTDVGIGLSYVAISITLVYLVIKARRDLPYHPVFIAFGGFIIACGATHLMHVWTMWFPNYWLEGYIKGVTLIASLATAVALPPIVPRVLALIAAAKLSEQRAAEIRSRDEFLSVAAHEFKTPITAINGYVQVLERRAAPAMSPKDQRGLRVIAEQAGRLRTMVEGLLDLSRIQSGRFQVEPAPLDLGTLAERVVEEIEPGLDQHKIELRRASAAAVIVRGDELRLGQMLHNLIGNAIKYSPLGGRVTVELARDSRSAGDSVCLSVSDQGIGIPRASFPHLFERFYRAPNVAQSGALDGFGIGLYVVKEIAERHGGSVEVASEEGKGSTFTVRLPVLAQDEATNGTNMAAATIHRQQPEAG